MANPRGGKALEDFLSESQEIIDGFSRDLLALDASRRKGEPDPEHVNNIFRRVHSLKGLAGMFGADQMSRLSHELENLLAAMRLGKVDVSGEILDLLFESVDVFNEILAGVAEGSTDPDRTTRFLGRLERIRSPAATPELGNAGLEDLDIDPGVLAVLTEYEEHRLRENIRQGAALYVLRARFELMSIDRELESLKDRVKPLGEIITTLPRVEGAGDDSIELDIILGSRAPRDEVIRIASATNVEVTPVDRKGGSEPTRRPTPVAPAQDFPTHPHLATVSPGEVSDREPEQPPVTQRTVAQELEQLGSLKSISQSVRVDIRKLDRLMNVAGELALSRASIERMIDRFRRRPGDPGSLLNLHRELRSFERRISELQDGILEVRMVPVGQIFDKLSRVVRRISRDVGKPVDLIIRGSETEVDKLIVEELSDPLMHIIRNAMDHGLESDAERIEAGKPSTGRIEVSAAQRGSLVVIDVRDDGRGIDEAEVIQAALNRGLIDAERVRDLTRRDVYALLFLPGFSTRDEASNLSGRGVGLDVVKTNISKLRGVIDVFSEPGKGTRITITLPMTLAILQALIVKVAHETYAIPLDGVLESILLPAHEIRTVERREVIRLREMTLPLLRLEAAFGLSREAPPGEDLYLVIVEFAQHHFAIVVDELIGRQDIVIKALGSVLSRIPGIAGATELGDQQTVLVLDVGALVEETLAA